MRRAWMFAAALGLHAHTYHASIAQLDYIPSKKTIETMIFVHAEDLERLMKDRLGPRASLDQAREAERFTRSYLRDVFVLADADGRPVPFEWVGLEVRTHFAVCYLEFPAAQGLGGMTLRNRIHHHLPDQTNTVRVKIDGKDHRDLEFPAGQGDAAQPLLGLKSR